MLFMGWNPSLTLEVEQLNQQSVLVTPLNDANHIGFGQGELLPAQICIVRALVLWIWQFHVQSR
jgi:hypothetical protein